MKRYSLSILCAVTLGIIWFSPGCENGPETPVIDFPQDTLPMDTLPMDTLPMDTFPMDTLPMDTLPMDTLPMDTLPMDTILPDPPEAIDLLLGTYKGTCYQYDSYVIFETGEWIITKDTFYDSELSLNLDEEFENGYDFRIGGSILFFPDKHYLSKEEILADTVETTRSWGRYRVELHWYKQQKLIHAYMLAQQMSNPGYYTLNCYCTKVE